MTDFIPTGDEVPLEINVSGSNSDSIKSFVFVFTRASDGEEIERVEGEISETRMGSGTWTATGLKNTEMNCRVIWEAKAGEQPAFGRGEIVVYRTTLEVTAKDADGAGVDKALCHVQVVPARGFTETCRTGSTRQADGNGKITFDDLPPGEVTVSFRTPFKLIEWVTDTGPAREAKIEKSYSACFVWPDPKTLGEKPHKQYVNLPATNDTPPEQGSLIKVKVKVDLATTAGGGITGDKIYLQVKFGAQNSDRNDAPKPSFGGNDGGKGKGPFVVDKALTSDDGTIEFEIQLGIAGGDEVEIAVGGDENCTDGTIKVVTWRKLWIKPACVAAYPLTNNQLDDETKDKINQTLLPVFIETEFEDALIIEDSRAHVVDQARARLLNMASHADAPFILFSNTGPEKAHFDKHVSDNPLRLYWLLANGLYAESKETFSLSFKGRTSAWQTAKKGGFLPVRPSTGDTTLMDWRDASAGYVHKVSKKVVGKYDAMACYWEKDDRSEKGEVDPAWIEVHSSNSKFRVVLPQTTGIGRKVPVGVYVRLRTYTYGGGSSSANWVTANVKKSNLLGTVYTILHELGHAINQTSSDNTGMPGLPAKHPHHYTGKGHSGPHCNYGLTTSQAAKEAYSPLVAKGKHGTCIMFGGVGPKTNYAKALTFCKFCEPYVKATKIESL